MGHGDEIAIVDANFPAESTAGRLVRLDGANATATLEAILSVLPIDTFAEDAAIRMAVVDKPDAVPPVCAAFREVLDRAMLSRIPLVAIERFDFYDRAKAAYAVVSTSERRLYGNIILRKGVIGVDPGWLRP